MRAALFFRGCGVALMIGAGSLPARAQTVSDKAAAESLFDQGRAAMQEGDFAKACGLLERSQHVDPGVGTLLYLGECYEKSGRTASAWATFREAADTAAASRDANRARIGRERAARVEPQLSRLAIQLSPEVQQINGLTIDRSGRGVQPAMWNVPVPVDPGDYAVTATAPGYETFSQTVTVGDRAARLSVTIPLLKKLSEPDATTPSASVSAAASSSPSPPPAPPDVGGESRGKGQRTIAVIVGGVGVVGVGVGTAFGLRAISKNREAKDRCTTGYACADAQGVSDSSEAKKAARVSDVAFSVGIAALVGGAVLYFTAPTRAPDAARPSLSAAVGPTGISLWGWFQ